MNIVVDDSSNLTQGGRGLVTGEIYFEENNNYFPEKGWNDFPVIILGWWVSNFLNFAKQNSKTFEFCFMDGPFKVVGTMMRDEMIEVSFLTQYENGSEKKCLGHVDKREIQNLLLSACRKLFRGVEVSSIPDDVLEGLKKLFNELKKMQL